MATKGRATTTRIVREDKIEFNLECTVPPADKLERVKAKVSALAKQFAARTCQFQMDGGTWRVRAEWPKESVSESCAFTDNVRDLFYGSNYVREAALDEEHGRKYEAANEA